MYLELLTLALRLAIAILCGCVVPAVRAWIDAKTSGEKYAQLKAAAETAVYAAEQIHSKLEEDESYQDARRKFAHKAISRAASRLGLALTEQEVNELLEAAVQELNLMKYGTVTEGEA